MIGLVPSVANVVVLIWKDPPLLLLLPQAATRAVRRRPAGRMGRRCEAFMAIGASFTIPHDGTSSSPPGFRTIWGDASSYSMNPSGESSRKSTVLCAVFFLSGASALIFETLWFRLAGLAFGNSVWASALVLSSFMAGLALGNGLAARHGHRIRRPERFYALIELVVAAAGILLVVSFPYLTRLLAPLFRPLVEHPLLLNALRLSISFLLLMLPATAMGLTLPLLVKALLGRREESFGKALGRLYGWNTLGAVAGALLGETVLIEAFGIVGTGVWAGFFNVLAAGGALAVARRIGAAAPPQSSAANVPLSPRARRILAAGFLSGGILLALEVVWFRFLQLFFPGTSLTFAVMLSVVLGGIGLGGLAASLWFRLSPGAHRRASSVALASGVVSILVYLVFDVVVGDLTEARVSGYGLDGFVLCVVFMFPVCFLSGVLFALIGHAVHEELADETRSAGLATMANTVGATLGPLVAGFLLIPRIGMERSFFVLGSCSRKAPARCNLRDGDHRFDREGYRNRGCGRPGHQKRQRKPV